MIPTNRQSLDHTSPLPAAGQTLVIEASAGTGKTWAIAHLAARFVAERGCPIESQAIVTFSNAAAAELKSRVGARLVECLAAADSTHGLSEELTSMWSVDESTRSQRKQRLAESIAHYDRASIFTTHSLCDRLLRELGPSADHETSDRLVTDLSDIIESVTTDLFLRQYAKDPNPPFSISEAKRWVKASMFSPTARIVSQMPSATAFVETARSLVDERKRAAGLYTFDDMLTRCQQALSDPETSLDARRKLTTMYPVVMVDEFQDTDDIQWQILKEGFAHSSTLVLIGDPKQSIYGFRGADVRAYLDAASTGTVVTLSTNYRSSPGVCDAVGKLMNGAELAQGIKVDPVTSSPMTPRLAHVEGTPWANPLRLRAMPGRLPFHTVDEARSAIRKDLVRDIVALLDHHAVYVEKATSGAQSFRELRPDDIAVIVSENKMAQAVLDDCHHAGIPAVAFGRSSVFSSESARHWLRLLTALESGDDLLSACVTSLIGWTVHDLANADSEAIGSVMTMMNRLVTVNSQRGAGAVMGWLEDHTNLMARLAARPDLERTLTDLRHIASLIQRANPPSASAWLTAQISSANSSGRDESARRLSTDDRALRILTIHKAKGLQFPVVYLPFLSQHWFSTPKNGSPITFDTDTGRAISLGMPSHMAQARDKARHSESEESLREAYVALTRGSTHITTWWVPSASSSAGSPLGRLLFRQSDHVPDSIIVDDVDPASILDKKGNPIDRGVTVEYMDSTPAGTYTPQRSSGHPREYRPFTAHVDPWMRTSFSGITAASHDSLYETDEPEVNGEPTDLHADDLVACLSPMADFPGGTAFGSLVHAIFEHADPNDPSFADEVSRQMTASGMTGFTVDQLVEALRPGLTTPLGEMLDNLSLSEIPARDKLAELSFEMPLAQRRGNTVADIAEVLRRHLPSGHPLEHYPQRLLDPALLSDPLTGYMTGSIDAVLRVGGRYVVVDYKTNKLGPQSTPLTLNYYTRAPMTKAMVDAHYPLQALLYEVALHRFLTWRLPGYDPHTHLGGTEYLFVRGMAGPSTPVVDGTTCGVFAWTFPAQLVVEVSDLLSGAHR